MDNTIGNSIILMTLESETSDVNRLNEIREEMASAEAERDPSVQISYMADDFKLYPPGGDPMGPDEFAAMLEELYASSNNIPEYHSDGLLVGGDLAVDSGTCRITPVDPDSDKSPRSANYLIVYRRTSDNDWEMIRDMWNWHD